ncbi:MAG: ATP-binding protein [Rhodospirillales bacterium]|jgi:uncharacterized protein|nr:ATP-binding protein [Rhodospirillales bacterium]
MLEISESDVLLSMRQDNTWWDNHHAPALADFSTKRAYFDNFKELCLNWNIKRSVILMGPRQVGKTVMLNQLIGELIDEGFPAESILFIGIDTPLYNGIHLEKLVKLFEKQTDHDPSGKRIVIFDEIQYLKDWEIHLKVLTDKLPNTRFIASGSAAAALKLKSQESGAGRFTDFFLPPLTFAEYLNFTELEDTLIQSKLIGENRVYTTNNIDKLNQEFINYINVGGYPEAVVNIDIRNNISLHLGRGIIDKVLLRDLPSLYGIRDIQELNRLFMTIAYHSGQEFSLENLSTSSGVAKNTINKYLEYLEAAFLITRVRRVDDSGKTFQRARQFKIYLTNPSMRAALFTPLKDGDNSLGAMVETAIFSQWFHGQDIKNIHYARWKTGRSEYEVDLVYLASSNLKPLWAVEIKWSNRHCKRPEELKGLIEFSKKNMSGTFEARATTKTVTTETRTDTILIDHIPSALQCYIIGKNVLKNKEEDSFS